LQRALLRSDFDMSRLGKWGQYSVAELQDAGSLLVEDGNHGEYRPLPHEFSLIGVSFIRATDLGAGNVQFGSASRINGTARARIRKGIGAGGDVILSHKGTVGKIAFAPLDCEPFVCSPQTTFWRSLDQGAIDRRYLYYYLCSDDFRRQLDARKGETDMADYVSLTAQRELRVCLPPIEEQRSIGCILGGLDDKIELNRRMNQTLESMARAIFRSWFVDFDPVRARVEGRDVGLPKPLADLFPASLKDSELGEIPHGWGVGHFGDVVERVRDQENPQTSPNTVFRHFSIPAFDEGQWPRTEFGANIMSLKSRVPCDVLLLSKLNPEIERVWVVDVAATDRALCSTEFLVLSPRSPYGRSYAYCLARSPSFRQQIEALVTGTSNSHQRAQADSILKLRVILPPKPIANAFDKAGEALLGRTLASRRESRTLATLRDTLLPKLMSGELRVRDAEKLAGSHV